MDWFTAPRVEMSGWLTLLQWYRTCCVKAIKYAAMGHLLRNETLTTLLC